MKQSGATAIEIILTILNAGLLVLVLYFQSLGRSDQGKGLSDLTKEVRHDLASVRSEVRELKGELRNLARKDRSCHYREYEISVVNEKLDEVLSRLSPKA